MMRHPVLLWRSSCPPQVNIALIVTTQQFEHRQTRALAVFEIGTGGRPERVPAENSVGTKREFGNEREREGKPGPGCCQPRPVDGTKPP